MADGGEGMVEEHAGTDVFHHGADLRPLLRAVAVDFAFAATGLGVAFRAVVEAPEGIVKQPAALFAEGVSGGVMSAAVYRNHPAHHCFLLFDSFHVAGLFWRYKVSKNFPDGGGHKIGDTGGLPWCRRYRVDNEWFIY